MPSSDPYSAERLGLRPVPPHEVVGHDEAAVEQRVRDFREAYPQVAAFGMSAADYHAVDTMRVEDVTRVSPLKRMAAEWDDEREGKAIARAAEHDIDEEE